MAQPQSTVPATAANQAFNRFCMDYAVKQGWLDDYRTNIAEGVLAEDPKVNILTYLESQGWLWPEQVNTIRQSFASRPQASLAPKAEAPPPPPAAAQPQVPEAAADGALPQLLDYLALGQRAGASDVHVGVGAPPIMRLHGQLTPLWSGAPALTAAQTERLLRGTLTDDQQELLKKNGSIDFSHTAEGLGRFRSSVVSQRLGLDGVFRIVGSKVRTMDELGLPSYLKLLTRFQNGLVLLTGPVGCGKSTTLAAFVEEINRDRRDHVITLEDPIEYLFEPKGCLISQREVRTHTESFSTALRGALREDPDVIIVGEMRDVETISLAVTAAETGHLVIGTLHTANASRTLDRILDVFPPEQQDQIRTMVSGSLRGIVSQQLVPTADGKGRVLACEVLINTAACASMIRGKNVHMLANVMQTGKQVGCRTMDDSLWELVSKKAISPAEAYARAEDRTRFATLSGARGA